MRFFDLLVFASVSFIWALNLIVSRLLFANFAIAPIFYAAMRFALVAVMLAPLLRPLPRPFTRVVAIGLLMGAMHFGLMFLSLSAASAASVSIVLQLSIPITAILSVILLKEHIGIVRSCGIATAFTGVAIAMWPADAQPPSFGLIFALLSAASIALGSILLKRHGPIRPLRLQAWVALVSFPLLAVYSALTELDRWGPSLSAGWPFWAGITFSTIIVTICAHTLYFSVLQRYPASLIAPLGLMMPLMSISMGVLILNEPFDLKTVIGGLLALSGLLLILTRKPRQFVSAPQEAS